MSSDPIAAPIAHQNRWCMFFLLTYDRYIMHQLKKHAPIGGTMTHLTNIPRADAVPVRAETSGPARTVSDETLHCIVAAAHDLSSGTIPDDLAPIIAMILPDMATELLDARATANAARARRAEIDVVQHLHRHTIRALHARYHITGMTEHAIPLGDLVADIGTALRNRDILAHPKAIRDRIKALCIGHVFNITLVELGGNGGTLFVRGLAAKTPTRRRT